MLKYTTKGGHQIEIVAYEYLGRALLCGWIDGNRLLDSVAGLLDKPQGDLVASLGRIGLTRERYDAVCDMQRELQESLDENPEVIRARLIGRRRNLVAEIGYVLDAAAEAHENAVAGMARNGYAPRPRDYSADEATARNALADFDTEHPEVLDWVREADAEALEHHLLGD
jgi:hypothetical protein